MIPQAQEAEVAGKVEGEERVRREEEEAVDSSLCKNTTA